MSKRTGFPSMVRIQAEGPIEAGTAVGLRFRMSRKNDFTTVAFLDAQGAAELNGAELLRSFEQQRNTFIQDYPQPEASFTGTIEVWVMDCESIQRALAAYKLYQDILTYPRGYEHRLQLAARIAAEAEATKETPCRLRVETR